MNSLIDKYQFNDPWVSVLQTYVVFKIPFLEYQIHLYCQIIVMGQKQLVQAGFERISFEENTNPLLG